MQCTSESETSDVFLKLFVMVIVRGLLTWSRSVLLFFCSIKKQRVLTSRNIRNVNININTVLHAYSVRLSVHKNFVVKRRGSHLGKCAISDTRGRARDVQTHDSFYWQLKTFICTFNIHETLP